MIERVAALVLSVLAGATNGVDAEWSQWRGPARTGIADGPVTARWPARSLSHGWTVEVGEGHAGPVVSGRRVYVHSRVGGDEVISAFDRADGGRVWSHKQAVAYTPTAAAAEHGSGPKATPLLHQGRVYAFGATGILTSLDMATGRVIWRRDWAGRYPQTWPLYGAAQSPVADGDRVILHVGGVAGGALTAFDAATGADRWTWAPAGEGPAYASPILATLHGVRQVVTLTEKRLIGVSAADGALLWSAPFTTMYDQNSVTPVVFEDLVIATGRLLWAGPGRQGENASLAVAGGDALVLTTEAELLVLKADADRFAPVATYGVADSPTWAHLAVARNEILVKDARTLSLWRVARALGGF